MQLASTTNEKEEHAQYAHSPTTRSLPALLASLPAPVVHPHNTTPAGQPLDRLALVDKTLGLLASVGRVVRDLGALVRGRRADRGEDREGLAPFRRRRDLVRLEL